MSKQNTLSSIKSPKEKIRQPNLKTSMENHMQYIPPKQSRESSFRHTREKESISSKISSVDFDFQSDINNEESPFSSCRSSLGAEFSENQNAYLKSRGPNSNESIRIRCENHPDPIQFQFSKLHSVSVGKVIDETIAAIEATNRELLSRAQAAEKSTRILQEQNSDLQRTLNKFTRFNPDPCSPPLANINHRSRPSLNFPRSNPIVPQHRNSLGHSVGIATGSKDSFDFLDAELTASLGSRDRSSHITQSMQSFHFSPKTPSSSLNSPLPLLPTSPPSVQHNNISKSHHSRKNSLDFGNTDLSHSNNVQSSSPFSSSDFQPLSSHPASNISSPLPGTVRYHPVTIEGAKFNESNRPKLVSLEEARRRAKYTSTTPMKSTIHITPEDNNHFIEGNLVSLSDEVLPQKMGEKEIKSEKKKNRLQDLFTGRRNGSRKFSLGED